MMTDAERARSRRDGAWGNTLTYSPKVFVPLTRLCRNRCDYCSFRRNARDPGAHTMSPDEVEVALRNGRKYGCLEALLCLGDEPEAAYPGYRAQLAGWGFDSTVAYLEWAARKALDLGLLPHTNAGVLERDDMVRLRRLNVSLGLMLENISDRLCEPGGPHHRAPDKRPARRVRMHQQAGELRIPFTSGLLIGIGETRAERVATLAAIAELHARYGHIQEVIVQNLRAHPQTPMAGHADPEDAEVIDTVIMARLMLPGDVSIQAPPNLNAGAIEQLIDAGVNDFGGISPVTPDFINPNHPWPLVAELRDRCRAKGFDLRPRAPIYSSFVLRPGWLDPDLTHATHAGLHTIAKAGAQIGFIKGQSPYA